MNHDISKLPKWAQVHIAKVENERGSALRALEFTRQAHTVLQGRKWFTIPGPPAPNEKPRHPWWSNHEHPFPACSLSHGDVLLIGRKES
jgi:hypothetical protein